MLLLPLLDDPLEDIGERTAEGEEIEFVVAEAVEGVILLLLDEDEEVVVMKLEDELVV